ncbi:MAG TPA: ATP-binding protein [Pyrinomonadaceae bacterium]|nr:ATP-binding protein [Pyrinomonadaceae bacterium]
MRRDAREEGVEELGIRGRLVLLAVGVAVPLALVGVVALRATWDASRRQLDDSIKQQAELAAVAFERWVDAQRQPLVTLSARVEERAGEAPSTLSDDMRFIVSSRPHWIDLHTVGPSGELLASHPAGREPPPSALVGYLLSETRRRNDWMVVTDRTTSEERPIFVIAAPLRGGGMIVARVDGAAVSEIFRDIRLPERAVIAVYDAENNLLYRRPATEPAVELTVDRSPFFAEFGDRHVAVFEFESPYDGVHRVYGLARAGATDCVAAVGVPSAVLYEPARRQQNRYLLFSLLALACAVAASLFVERGLARPVLRLREAARDLGAGDLRARAPVRGGGEIGELGASFNLMAERIAEREERLKELDRLKSEFVSGVSHELRTPLTTIKTLTRLLQRGVQTEAERQEYLETIAAECDRQIDLVLNLLDLSRIEAGAFKVSLTPTDVAEVIRACVRIERHAARARGQELAAELSENELPPVMSDASALRRVLCGLVENAIKYTPAGGRITLGARHDGKAGVAITVADTGVGILAEDMPLVFEKFFRGRPAASVDGAAASELGDYAEAPGVGLGLYLARSIVEQFGGRIEAAEGARRGTVFTIYLPAWRDGEDRGGDAPGEEARESEAFARG